MSALHDLIDVAGGLGFVAILCELFVPDRYRSAIWTAVFVEGAATSTVHLLSPNPVWAMYHLCWVIIGIAVGTRWWQTGHHLVQPERPRRDSNADPSA